MAFFNYAGKCAPTLTVYDVKLTKAQEQRIDCVLCFSQLRYTFCVSFNRSTLNVTPGLWGFASMLTVWVEGNEKTTHINRCFKSRLTLSSCLAHCCIYLNTRKFVQITYSPFIDEGYVRPVKLQCQWLLYGACK